MRMYTSPGSPAGASWPSASSTRTSVPSHGLPTEPGRASHSGAVMAVPPPSLAA
jgi:hypothetical protein